MSELRIAPEVDPYRGELLAVTRRQEVTMRVREFIEWLAHRGNPVMPNVGAKLETTAAPK